MTRMHARGVILLAVGAGVALQFNAPRIRAEDNYSLPRFQSDYGGVGLLQTPTARMVDVGEFSFTYDQTDPYRHYAFSLQPLDWFELGLRYTKIDGQPFIASEGELDYLDKGIDMKFALLDETRVLPKVSLGFRDVGGTGLFSSEYVVANKRWFDFDFSLGIAWGYLGSSENISNPLSALGERFDERREEGGGDQGGEFDFKGLFTGRPALFGGIQYRTPFKPLTLQLEYDGNDYESEPLGNDQEQDLPVNIGARYRVNDYFTLSAAWQRGNTAMVGATLSVNLADITQPKSDQPPVPVRSFEDATRDREISWNGVAGTLARNAGISVNSIKREDDALIVEGTSERYSDLPEAELRGNRILHNVAGADITTFRYRWKNRGFYLRQDSLPRAPLPENPRFLELDDPFIEDDYRDDIAVTGQDKPADGADAEVLHSALNNRFSWNLSPALNYNYGGPDGFLYEVYARLDTEFKTDENGWLSGTLGYGLFDNLDNFDYVGPSELPRVRTNTVDYIEQTELGIYNLQYTRTARLGRNWFAMGYAGYLERMFAGAGGEVLYRPFNSPLALGFNANWVKKREFDTQFGLRDYSTWTGHATAYVDTGIKDVLAKFSVGRYLAKDVGATLDLSRTFDSGVRIGAFATLTDAGDSFGEGSFDKGIYLSMPLDVFYTTSTRDRTGILWRPLTRDGGQMLDRRYQLYDLTSDREPERYWDNFTNGRR
ncbi:YjbH domain-containing protein [Salinisphaera orenii]|uniref:Exopolysaccharide biosynthesis protein YbjH n=1 Tax=Salinisphaera orenii YIM 95161 TaxID=1051139 RepID=A0A423Q1L2_9GAMM|nr:YjbH domain-containing protein [Salinisphaera halophila]ROO32396.1 hypothetical protein SAHL_05085 [Salinisphaera halophila YIM 95161]